MKRRLLLSMFLVVLVCLAASCASKPPCLIAPPHDYHGNMEAAQKVAADLTKLTKMPLDANLESTFKNEIKVSYQDIPDKDVRCQMFLQAITCLAERKDTGADLLASKLMDCLIQEHVCTGEKVEPLKMKLQRSVLPSGNPELGQGKIGPFEVSASRNVSADPDNGWKKGVKVALPAGTWSIFPMGGGWSAWPTDAAAKLVGVKTPWTWLVNITIANGTTECYVECGDWWKFATQKDAEDFALQQLEPYSLFIETPSEVCFWIPDTNEDNRKGVIIEIRRVK